MQNYSFFYISIKGKTFKRANFRGIAAGTRFVFISSGDMVSEPANPSNKGEVHLCGE
jgi:hypothetical protein